MSSMIACICGIEVSSCHLTVSWEGCTNLMQYQKTDLVFLACSDTFLHGNDKIWTVSNGALFYREACRAEEFVLLTRNAIKSPLRSFDPTSVHAFGLVIKVENSDENKGQRIATINVHCPSNPSSKRFTTSIFPQHVLLSGILMFEVCSFGGDFAFIASYIVLEGVSLIVVSLCLQAEYLCILHMERLKSIGYLIIHLIPIKFWTYRQPAYIDVKWLNQPFQCRFHHELEFLSPSLSQIGSMCFLHKQ